MLSAQRSAGTHRVALANEAALSAFDLQRADLDLDAEELFARSGMDEGFSRELMAALDRQDGELDEDGEPRARAEVTESAPKRWRGPTQLTTAITNREGRRSWISLTLTPVTAPELGPEGHVIVIRDVSAQVEHAHVDQMRLEIERRARLALSILARVSDILAEPDPQGALRHVADLVTPRVVAWCGFFALGRDLEAIHDVVTRLPARRDRGTVDSADDPVLSLLEATSMRTVRLEPGHQAERGTVTARLQELLAPHLEDHPDAEGSVLVFPVLGRMRTLGLFVALPYRGPASTQIAGPVGSPEPSAAVAILPEEVGTVLELVARRVGMAMDNAELYYREHLAAETLQRSMLPEQAEIDGLDVWSYYAPSVEHAQVGGDWYDVVELDDETVLVVVGDVTGHDLEAAAAMGQLRSIVRAYAQDLREPGAVLDRVDALVTSMHLSRSASLVLFTLTRHPESTGDDETWVARYSRAGHLPALVRHSGGVDALEGAAGALVGFGRGDRCSAERTLRPGDCLVLYTDGLVERRNQGMREGLERLIALAGTVDGADAAAMGEELLQLATEPEDDIALVVIRVPDTRYEPAENRQRRRRWPLAPSGESISRARAELRATCAAWGVQATGELELVVSELVTNAVLHGRGLVEFRLLAVSGGLRVEVEDGDPTPPVIRDQTSGRVGGYGMHIVEQLAEWGWRPTPGGKVVWAKVRVESAAG
ncbi:ATP-binding SpoIIE family protein phosphatase [Bogoriella caseilytica]|uniref:Histidine kinase-like protein n=1 Tax=Bogoriella caseilytica TaxID=56055 RepID=A0A3N2BBD5_9MICO|nr:ATP-binding SpoIIE family protein phosphatase [Bogoriella caseilytica]ROR72569.1 histidine kinase-like protein [Bogoriella caseilytica]